MKVLITGCAGFIGMQVALCLLSRGDEVVGVDNLNDYYAVALKEARLAHLTAHKFFRFYRVDIVSAEAFRAIFAAEQPQRVINLAAQAGVRYSLENPRAYIEANIAGFLNVLENCRQYGVEQLVYASSSSVYGGNIDLPFTEHQNVDHPVSLYAATKKSNELMAHTYSHLFNLPTIGLRFFTVYGPWGRPDMALFKFTRAILAGEPIDVYNEGRMRRDFTYIDDIVEGTLRVLDRVVEPTIDFDRRYPDPAGSWAPYRVFNMGNQEPTPLMEYIQAIEEATGRKARMNLMPLQPGDVTDTHADTEALRRYTDFQPKTSVRAGVIRFVDWYLQHQDLLYQVSGCTPAA